MEVLTGLDWVYGVDQPVGIYNGSEMISTTLSAKSSTPTYGYSNLLDYVSGADEALVIGDIDGDGADEVYLEGSVVSSSRFTGGGHTTSTYDYAFSPNWHAHYNGPRADFNGDGLHDVVISSTGLLLGSSSLGPAPDADVEFSNGGYPALGDFNGDGLTDIAVLGGPGILIPGIAE